MHEVDNWKHFSNTNPQAPRICTVKKAREGECLRSTSMVMMMNIKVLSASIYYLKPVLEQKMNIRRRSMQKTRSLSPENLASGNVSFLFLSRVCLENVHPALALN